MRDAARRGLPHARRPDDGSTRRFGVAVHAVAILHDTV